MKVANSYSGNNSLPQQSKVQQKEEEKNRNWILDSDNQQVQKDKLSQNSSLQNGAVTNFYFEKLMHIQYQLTIVVAINIFLIVMSSSLTFPQTKPQNETTIKACLYFCIVCFIAQCMSNHYLGILVSFRMITSLELQKQQRILYPKSTIFSSKKIFIFLVQCLVLMIQPYPFFVGQYFQTQNSYQNVNFYFPINDLLTILSTCRIYVLIRAALLISPYKTNRSNRLCRMYGCQADFAFSLKCLFKDNPLILILIFFFTSSLMFAFQIYLAERYAFRASKYESLLVPNTICNDFFNSFWLILMTITTVGYGDYFPQTPLGRIIILVVAVWGTFIVSIMVVVVSNTLSMQKNQKRTSVIVNKLQLRSQIQQKAKKVIGYRMLFNKSKKEFNLNPTRQTKQKFTKLKIQYNKWQKNFSQLRKQLKLITNYQDIEDEVSSHFLIINNDIQILNRNQQNIINFIHQNLQYQANNNKYEDQIEEQEDNEDKDTNNEITAPKDRNNALMQDKVDIQQQINDKVQEKNNFQNQNKQVFTFRRQQ